MTTYENIFGKIAEVPEFYSDVGALIADYTNYSEEECAKNTEGSLRCWNYEPKHQDCDRYCIKNSEPWLMPFLDDLAGYYERTTLLVQDRHNFITQPLLLRTPTELLFETPEEEQDKTFSILTKKLFEIYTSAFKIVFTWNSNPRREKEVYIEVNDPKILDRLPDETETNKHLPTLLYERNERSLRIQWASSMVNFIYYEFVNPLLDFLRQNQVNSDIHMSYTVGTSSVIESFLFLEWLTQQLHLPGPERTYTTKDFKKLIQVINSNYAFGLVGFGTQYFVYPGDLLLAGFEGETQFSYKEFLLQFTTSANFSI